MAIITFDFDETLTRPVWNEKYQLFEPSENPNHDACAKLLEFHKQGKRIEIVTTRWRSEEVADFIKQHQLPVAGIHCTEGELKATKLFELNSELHFDDNKDEAIANLGLEIPTVIVSFRFDVSSQTQICEFNLFA